MEILYISGSPRSGGNTDILLESAMGITGGKLIRLSEFRIDPCRACWACLGKDSCVLRDDMTDRIIPMLLQCQAMIIGSPVFFNNVTSILKTFIDRTWCIRGKLKNKIGGAIVIGREYGHESAITAIHAFFLKHEMIPANRGVSVHAFMKGEILRNVESVEAVKQLGERIMELGRLLNPQKENRKEK